MTLAVPVKLPSQPSLREFFKAHAEVFLSQVLLHLHALFFSEHARPGKVVVSYRLRYVGGKCVELCLSRLPSFILPKFGSEVPELVAYGVLAYFCEKGVFNILLVLLKSFQCPLEAFRLRLGVNGGADSSRRIPRPHGVG